MSNYYRRQQPGPPPPRQYLQTGNYPNQQHTAAPTFHGHRSVYQVQQRPPPQQQYHTAPPPHGWHNYGTQPQYGNGVYGSNNYGSGQYHSGNGPSSYGINQCHSGNAPSSYGNNQYHSSTSQYHSSSSSQYHPGTYTQYDNGIQGQYNQSYAPQASQRLGFGSWVPVVHGSYSNENWPQTHPGSTHPSHVHASFPLIPGPQQSQPTQHPAPAPQPPPPKPKVTLTGYHTGQVVHPSGNPKVCVTVRVEDGVAKYDYPVGSPQQPAEDESPSVQDTLVPQDDGSSEMQQQTTSPGLADSKAQDGGLALNLLLAPMLTPQMTPRLTPQLTPPLRKTTHGEEQTEPRSQLTTPDMDSDAESLESGLLIDEEDSTSKSEDSLLITTSKPEIGSDKPTLPLKCRVRLPGPGPTSKPALDWEKPTSPSQYKVRIPAMKPTIVGNTGHPPSSTDDSSPQLRPQGADPLTSNTPKFPSEASSEKPQETPIPTYKFPFQGGTMRCGDGMKVESFNLPDDGFIVELFISNFTDKRSVLDLLDLTWPAMQEFHTGKEYTADGIRLTRVEFRSFRKVLADEVFARASRLTESWKPNGVGVKSVEYLQQPDSSSQWRAVPSTTVSDMYVLCRWKSSVSMGGIRVAQKNSERREQLQIRDDLREKEGFLVRDILYQHTKNLEWHHFLREPESQDEVAIARLFNQAEASKVKRICRSENWTPGNNVFNCKNPHFVRTNAMVLKTRPLTFSREAERKIRNRQQSFTRHSKKCFVGLDWRRKKDGTGFCVINILIHSGTCDVLEEFGGEVAKILSPTTVSGPTDKSFWNYIYRPKSVEDRFYLTDKSRRGTRTIFWPILSRTARVYGLLDRRIEAMVALDDEDRYRQEKLWSTLVSSKQMLWWGGQGENVLKRIFGSSNVSSNPNWDPKALSGVSICEGRKEDVDMVKEMLKDVLCSRKPDGAEAHCQDCGENDENSIHRLTNCEHAWCDQCFSLCAFQERFPIRCGVQDCDALVSLKDIKAILPGETMMGWLASLAAAEYIKKDLENISACLTKDCKSIIRLDPKRDYNDAGAMYMCPKCSFPHCVRCKTFHDGLTCEQSRQLQMEQIAKLDEILKQKEVERKKKKKAVEDDDAGKRKYQITACPKCHGFIRRGWGSNVAKCPCGIFICWCCEKIPFKDLKECEEHMLEKHQVKARYREIED